MLFCKHILLNSMDDLFFTSLIRSFSCFLVNCFVSFDKEEKLTSLEFIVDMFRT